MTSFTPVKVTDPNTGKSYLATTPEALAAFQRTVTATAQGLGTKPEPPKPKQSFITRATNAVKGVANFVGNVQAGGEKGAFHTIDNIASLGQRALGTITGIKAPVGQIFTPEQKTPEGFAQKVGFGAEQVGEFFIPAGATEKAVTKIAEATSGLGKAGKILSLAGKVGLGSVEAAGVTAAQGGSKHEVANAAKFGAAFPVAAAALKGSGKVVSESAKFISSKLSGVPKDAIEYAFSNPQRVQSTIARAAAEGGEAAAQRIRQQAVDALEVLKEGRRTTYSSNLAQLEKDTLVTKKGQLYVRRALTPAEAAETKGYKGGEALVPTNLTLKGVKDTITKTVKEFGATGSGTKLGFKEVPMDEAHIEKLNRLVNRVYEWDNASPTGLDKLRQIINGYRPGGINLSSSEKRLNAIITRIDKNLSSYLGDRVPQIRKLNADYAAQSEVIDNILSQLKLESNDPNTALRKLVNVFNPKSQIYRPIVEELGQKAGVDLMSEIAGLTMSRWTAEGLAAFLTTGLSSGFGGLALANPASLAGIPATLAASSPRLIGNVATGLGKLSENPAIQKARQGLPTALKGLGVQVSR